MPHKIIFFAFLVSFHINTTYIKLDWNSDNFFTFWCTLLKTPSLIELTSKELCSEGDYLSWSNANWTFWGNVTKSANVDFCTKETFPHLYFFPAHFHLWENCISLCPRFQEGGRIPFVLPLFYLCFRRVGGSPLLPMPPTLVD